MKNIRFIALSIAVAALFVIPTAGSAANLGSGYSCKNHQIYKGGKVVKVGVAKAAVANTIKHLGNSKADKKKKATLTALKAALQSCVASSGGGGGSSTTLSQIVGSKNGIRYVGPYNSGSTNLHGVWDFEFSQYGDSTQIIVDLADDKSLTNYVNNDPSFYPQISPSTKLPFSSSETGGYIGDYIITIAASGAVTFDSKQIPADKLSSSTVVTELSLTFTPSGDGYTGTFVYKNGSTIVDSGTGTLAATP